MQDLKIDISNVILDLEATTNIEALGQLSELMQHNGYVKASYKDAVIEREGTFATGLPTVYCSVAIPHTDTEHVLSKAIGVAVLKETVPFVIMGELEETTDVKLIFMLAMDKEDAQLSLLQKLIAIFQNDELLSFIANTKNKQSIVDAIDQALNESK